MVTPRIPDFFTLAERKSAEAGRRRRAADAVVEDLGAFARRRGGRFVVFGSYVAGTMRHDSDLDVLVDFASEDAGMAWRFVEATCAERGIPPDLHDAATSRAGFVDRVWAQGRSLP